MSDTSNETTNTLLGWIIFFAIAAGWSFLNYRGVSQEIYQDCMDVAKISSISDKDQWCSCSRDKIMEEVSVLSHIPIAGRFLGTKEEDLLPIVNRAGSLCAARNPMVTFTPRTSLD
ncbi:MAG: hypothetical protein AAGB16_04740 [Pseudomonadota bacterium]